VDMFNRTADAPSRGRNTRIRVLTAMRYGISATTAALTPAHDMIARRRNCAAAAVLTVLLCSSSTECQAVQDINDFTTALARLGQSQLHFEHAKNRDGVANRTAGSSETATETAEESQQKLYTSGVSTYSSSKLFENVFAKQTKPLSHKPLWPLDSRDWWTLGIATLAIFVAAGGGIGGGGVLVPLYASVLGRFM